MAYNQFKPALLALLFLTLTYKVCVCFPLSNDASPRGGDLENARNKVMDQSFIATPPGKGFEKLSVKLDLLMPTSIASTKTIDNLNAAVKVRSDPVANQVSFVLRLMGQILAALRSVTTATTSQTAMTHVNSAISKLDELMRQATALITAFPASDQGLARRALDFWVDALTVVRETLVGFVAAATDLAGIKGAAQRVIDQLGQGFWTRAEAALNGYVSLSRFTEAWNPWFNSIRDYMDS